jgi:hypothetical protein
VNFPFVAGFGSGNFYGEEGFAYASGGVVLSYGLSFIPECYGKWSINAGYTLYYLDSGNSLDNFNTEEVVGQNDSIRERSEWESVFSGGIGLVF